MLCGPSLYQSTPEKKLRACEAALEALSTILPQEKWASTYHPWHDDLHEENIVVDPEDPSIIMTIIDWQSSFVAPLFDHVIKPAFLNYEGPSVNGLEPPPPPDISHLSTDETAAAVRLYDQQLLVSGYKFLLQNTIESAFEAQMYGESDGANILTASRDTYGPCGEGHCLVALTEPDDTPVKFSDKELQSIQRDAEKIMQSLGVMNAIKVSLGELFPDKGVVRPDQYEDAKLALRNAKLQIIEDFSSPEQDRGEWEEAWPFDD